MVERVLLGPTCLHVSMLVEPQVLNTVTSCSLWQGCTSDVALFNVKNPFYSATVPVCPAVTDPAFYTGECDEDHCVMFFVWNN